MSKHSEGPWKINPTDDTLVIDADLNEVCDVTGGYNQPDSWAVMEANARLIAASPELLEALEALVNMYIANKGSDHEFVKCITPRHASEMTDEERKLDKTWSVFDAARAAISKAKGENNVQR